MQNEIEQLAQQNDMSIEFVTWFFNEKKETCGNVWFMMMAAMWEGWKGRSIEMDKLAAENAALKAAFNKPDAWLSCHSIPPTYQEPDRGGEYLAVHEQPGEKNDDGSDSWPVYAKPEIETPATDRIVAGIKADGVEEFAAYQRAITEEWACKEGHSSLLKVSESAEIFAKQLRERADKC